MKNVFTTLAFLLLSHFLFAETFYIKHFDVKIEVNQDGFFEVTETLDVFFQEESRGIIRAIPRMVMVDGKKYFIQIKNIKVDDWKMKAYKEEHIQMIRIGEKNTYLDGDQKYIIRYRVYDAFHFLENHIEFKWNITGDEWEVPIHKATYSVFFPDNVNLNQNDFLVAAGRRDENNNNVIANFDGQFLRGETTQKLQPKEGVSLYAKLPKDYIDAEVVAATMEKVEEPFKMDDPFFALPIALLGTVLGWFWSKGRRRKLEVDESFEHYPPDDLNPSEVSAFFERKPDTEDLVALLPMWANMGYVRIQGGKEDDGGLRFERIQYLPVDANDYEHTIFDALFSQNEIVFLRDLKEKIYPYMYQAKTELGKSIQKRQYLFDEEAVRTFHSGRMIAMAFAFLVSGIVTLVLTKGTVLITGILLIVAAIVLFVIYSRTPKMSEAGEKKYIHIHRFRNFLKSDSPENVDKLLEEDPSYFEKMYPYAVAFGLDQVYSQKFEDSMNHAPSWYYYDNTNSNYSDSRPMSAFNDFSAQFRPSEIKQVFNTAPPSSSSSGGGFSGGGSSGGGFGGGGGSSW